MRGLVSAVLFSVVLIGFSQAGTDEVPKDVKKDSGQVVPAKDDAAKNPNPKDEPKKDAPKADAPKDAPKTEPAKDSPKPDAAKDTPKKDAPKMDAPKDAPKTEPVKDSPKMDKSETKKEEKKDNGMLKLGEIRGKVVLIDETKKTLKIAVPALNPDVAVALAKAELDLQRASIPQPGQNPANQLQNIANIQNNIAQQQAKLYSKTQDVELICMEDLVVRLAQPAPQFDDRGKLMRLTAKQKAELKGDPKLPGYKGEFADLKTNQYIQVTVWRSKTAKAPKLKPGKEIDPALLEELKPHVSMIVILGEPRMPGK